MAFNGVRKLSSVVEVGQLAQKLKRNTHKYIMVFTLRSVFGLFHRLHRTYWFRQHQPVQRHPENESSALFQTPNRRSKQKINDKQ
jgi:hypothetical protein